MLQEGNVGKRKTTLLLTLLHILLVVFGRIENTMRNLFSVISIFKSFWDDADLGHETEDKRKITLFAQHFGNRWLELNFSLLCMEITDNVRSVELCVWVRNL